MLARIVATTEDYRSSSYAANAHGIADSLVRPHPTNYVALEATDTARLENYRALISQSLAEDDLLAIWLHAQRQHALGSNRFRAAIEVQLGRRAGPGDIGRPRKAPKLQESAL